MSDAAGDHGGHEAHDDHGHGHGEPEGIVRRTAPMQAFRTRHVWIGLVVLLVGLAITFGLPLALV